MKAVPSAGRTPRSLLATAWRHRPRPWQVGHWPSGVFGEKWLGVRPMPDASKSPRVERIAKHIPQPRAVSTREGGLFCQRLLAHVLDTGRGGTGQ